MEESAVRRLTVSPSFLKRWTCFVLMCWTFYLSTGSVDEDIPLARLTLWALAIGVVLAIADRTQPGVFPVLVYRPLCWLAAFSGFLVIEALLRAIGIYRGDWNLKTFGMPGLDGLIGYLRVIWPIAYLPTLFWLILKKDGLPATIQELTGQPGEPRER